MKTLDHLILNELNPANPAFSCNPGDCQTYESLVRTTKNLIFKKVFQLIKEDEVGCYIRNYQRHLIFLSDCITGYRDKISQKSPAYADYIRLLDQVSDHVVGLLDFLNSYFTTHVDLDKEVPNCVKEKAKKRFASKIKQISNLGDFIDDELLKTVLLPAFEFQIDGSENTTTFRRITYLEVLLNEIIDILKKKDDVEDRLKLKLIYLNYNSFRFFYYLQNELKESISAKMDGPAKICALNWHLKQISQMGEKIGFALNPQTRSIKERLLDWIREEISYIEKFPNKTVAHQSSEEKINIGSSVPQLGSIIAIMVKLGFITERERKKLVKMFARGFKTMNSPMISEKHLYNQSKDPASSAREWVKNNMIKAINLINEL